MNWGVWWSIAVVAILATVASFWTEDGTVLDRVVNWAAWLALLAASLLLIVTLVVGTVNA